MQKEICFMVKFGAEAAKFGSKKSLPSCFDIQVMDAEHACNFISRSMNKYTVEHFLWHAAHVCMTISS